MVVPAVGIVPSNDDCGVFPLRAFHECVDYVHDEDLLVNGIRVTSMAVLIGTGFEIANRWQVAVLKGRKEICEVILMISLVGLADHANRAGTQVVWVGGAVKVHKRLMMGNIVAGVCNSVVACESRVMLSAHRPSLPIHTSRSESTLEPAPSDSPCVQQIAYVRTRHRDLIHVLKLRIRRDTVVLQRPGIADDRPSSGAARYVSICSCWFSIGPRR